MNKRFQKYIEYILNTGGSPKIEHFDDDWEPIGPLVRRDMKLDNLIDERDGRIYLTSNPQQ